MTEVTVAAATTVSGATVERTSWDDPRVAALREAMDAEIGPRYADVVRNVAPPPVDVADIVAVFLATVDGEPVATASLKRTGAFAEVKRVFVHVHGRRRGLASVLLRTVEDEARALGYASAHLQTGFRQPEAQRLYEREGWHRVPPFGPYAEDTVVSVTYAKPLAQPLLAADVSTAVPAGTDLVGTVVGRLEALDATGVDVAFLDDAYLVPDGVVRADAPTLAAVAAHRTHRIALVPSVTTTHTEPFHLSKVIQTLDWVTRGRAGVRLTVSHRNEEAAAFGRRPAPRPDDAWAEAADVIEAARRLWDSWEDDAEIRDIATGRFIDAEKVHYTSFTGPWFSVQGPSIVPRSPQGLPPVVVAYDDAAAGAQANALAVADLVRARSIDDVVRARALVSPAARVLVEVDAAVVTEESTVADLAGGANGIVLTGPANEVRRAARRLERGGRAAGADATAGPLDRADRPGTAPAYPGAPQPPTPVTLRARLGLARPASRYAAPAPLEVTR